MSITPLLLKHIFKKRATILYPFKEREKVHLPKGFRGELTFYREKCVGCGLCARACPSEAVEMSSDEKGKRPVFYLDRCTRCQQCEEACPSNAIELTQNFETVYFDRKLTVIK
jgi:formate hydrogenlyase subunit 6/NADH:ubiquinone oxidoreductase subunit I